MDFLGPKVDLEPMKVFQGTPDDTLIKSVGAHCDAEYGGGSESAHEFVEEEGQPFLRWKGKMNFKEEHIVKTKATGGFCALKIDFKKPIDLLDFQGLEISLRTRKDLRIFVNLRFSTYIENDMYQMCLELKGERDWKTLFTPFGMYQLTSNGNMKEQMMQNDHLQLESVGLLVTDSQAGEFSVDIRHIQAMNAGM
ncbi:NADH:ubiquinone oxidoreductase intermediate-associated protein 30 [Ochromonadaceae sp. CCMP2298]|nr:NADH:ubiquinone oxidoreductase intermediate-associated protein 30 [Ochromonadaceae sp. CCMP2298]